MVDGLDEQYRPQVLGGHATLWSDQFIHGTILQEITPINENRSEKYFDYLTFPRMSALAEVLWTPVNQQSWDDFENRMRLHYNRYDHAKYGYRMPQPKLIAKEKIEDGFLITLGNIVEGAEIRYTVDGISPNIHSPIYTGPVEVKSLSQFMAITVLNSRQFSLPLYFPVSYAPFKKYGKLIAEWKPYKINGEKYSIFEMNATGKINKNGQYELSFFYISGDNKLEMESIEVFKNGKKITEDIHLGITGETSKDNIYKFKINEYETGAAFTVKASVRGDKGNNTFGAVFIRIN
jgi:hexosaminidase